MGAAGEGGGLITVVIRCKKQKAVCNVCKMLSFQQFIEMSLVCSVFYFSKVVVSFFFV